MILCHDKIRQRAKQIEKFAEVAIRLRNMNNYSGLRAIVTAVHQSTYPGDEVMELFKQKTDLHKKFLSSDILLRTSGAHRSYRLALRNTRGPCIPCIEVHTSDMRRAHEGNPDIKADDPSKVHWAKFDMLGKFITATTQYQRQCLGPNGYKLHENPALRQLFEVPVMDYDVSRLSYVSTHRGHCSQMNRCNKAVCTRHLTKVISILRPCRPPWPWIIPLMVEKQTSSNAFSFGLNLYIFASVISFLCTILLTIFVTPALDCLIILLSIGPKCIPHTDHL